MSSVAEVTDKDFKNEVLDSEVPVLVDFWAPWCNPCRMMGPVIDSISQKHSPDLKVMKMNTDLNRKTPSDYNVRGIPCLIVFKGGMEVDRIVGFTPEGQLEEKLKVLQKK